MQHLAIANPVRKKSAKMRDTVSFVCCLFCLQAMAENALTPLATMLIESDGSQDNALTTTHTQTALTHDRLAETQMPDITDTLRNQTGITLAQGTGNMMSVISLRGAGGAGQGLLTLDGIPLFGNFAGLYSLSHYPTDAIEQVTLTRGPGDERHGSRTLGGAIHLQTRQFQHNEGLLRFEGGSYDTLRGAVGKGLENAAGNFNVVVGRSDVFSGLSQSQYGNEHDNFGMTHASANWLKSFAKGRLNASLYFVRSDEDMDGPGRLGKKVHWLDDKRGRLSDETWVTQIQGDYDLSEHWTTSLQAGFTQDRQNMVTSRIKPFAITNQLLMIEWKNTHPVFFDDPQHQAQFSWGVNAQHQQNLNFTAQQTVISPTVRGEVTLNQWKWLADGRFDFGEPYGNHAVFSLGTEREIFDTVRLYANGGSGFRQPAVSELMHPVFGNQQLRGESSAGGEMGVNWTLSPATQWRVSGYYQNYLNMIVLQANSTTGVIRADNASEAIVWGSEVQGKHRWTDAWETGLNYTYQCAINPMTHLHIPNRPEHQGTLWNEWRLLSSLMWRIEFSIHDTFWFDQGNTMRANMAPRVNTLLKYDLTPKIQLYLRGENITNNHVAELNDFNFYGAAVYAGARASF